MFRKKYLQVVAANISNSITMLSSLKKSSPYASRFLRAESHVGHYGAAAAAAAASSSAGGRGGSWAGLFSVATITTSNDVKRAEILTKTTAAAGGVGGGANSATAAATTGTENMHSVNSQQHLKYYAEGRLKNISRYL